jgi:adhesin transport system membrane fusion protein
MVRIGAYDYSSFGALRATLFDISPDTQANDRGERFFRVKVSIASDAVQRFGHTLSPGMSATVDVIVGRITVFQYMVRPLRNAAEQAMKDRV